MIEDESCNYYKCRHENWRGTVHLMYFIFVVKNTRYIFLKKAKPDSQCASLMRQVGYGPVEDVRITTDTVTKMIVSGEVCLATLRSW